MRTWAGEMSPACQAARAAGMARSWRASRTSPATCARGSRAPVAIQSVADRDPSPAHTARLEIASSPFSLFSLSSLFSEHTFAG